MDKLEDATQDNKTQEPESIDEKALTITRTLGKSYHIFGGDPRTSPEYGHSFCEGPYFIRTSMSGNQQRVIIVYQEPYLKRLLFLKIPWYNERKVYDQFNTLQDGKVIEKGESMIALGDRWLPGFEELYKRAREVEKSIVLEDIVQNSHDDPGL